MGELADRYWRDVVESRAMPSGPGQGGPSVSSDQLAAWARTRDAIAELEQQIFDPQSITSTYIARLQRENDLLRDAADESRGRMFGTVNDAVGAFQRLDAWREANDVDGGTRSGTRRDPDTGMRVALHSHALVANQRILDAAESRAIAAERRADELLAAVSELVQYSAKLTAVTRVVSIRNYADDGEWFTRLELHGPLMSGLTPGGHVAVLSPSSDIPNPELLERASMQLAEAYIKAKQKADDEARRLADAKALTARIVAAITTARKRGHRVDTISLHPDDERAILQSQGLSTDAADGVTRLLDVPVDTDERLSRGSYKMRESRWTPTNPSPVNATPSKVDE